ncbi:MAG: hypothetical protein JF616_19925 [Fibrobacteres bacterium]|nr:hypothetical protein [Fibrobacterota bacterium]
MKRSGFSTGFALSALVVAVCSLRSMAAVHSLSFGAGSVEPLQYLSASQGGLNDPNNPNRFPVYYVESSVTAVNRFGFLLDGSEWAKLLVKKIEDAYANKTMITIYYDDSFPKLIKVEHALLGANVSALASPIIYITTWTTSSF